MHESKAKRTSTKQVVTAVVGDTITIRVVDMPRGHGQRVVLEIVASSGEKSVANEPSVAG